MFCLGSKRKRNHPNKLNDFALFTNTSAQHEPVDKDIAVSVHTITIHKNVYPNLFKFIQVAITIPVSSATCERSFSAMRRVKNWLRTTMGQNRFTSLASIYIERDITNNINNE